MEIKTEVKTVPVTINRKVKTRVVVLTEREAFLIRDIIGGSVITRLAEAVVRGSDNYSKLNQVEAAAEIYDLFNALNALKNK